MARKKLTDDDEDFDEDDTDDDDEDDDDELEIADWATGVELPTVWEDWIEYDWDDYGGEYEEFAVSADYE